MLKREDSLSFGLNKTSELSHVYIYIFNVVTRQLKVASVVCICGSSYISVWRCRSEARAGGWWTAHGPRPACSHMADGLRVCVFHVFKAFFKHIYVYVYVCAYAAEIVSDAQSRSGLRCETFVGPRSEEGARTQREVLAPRPAAGQSAAAA